VTGARPTEERTIAEYLGTDLRETGDWERGEVVIEAEARLAPHLAGPAGGMRTGALLALVDNAGGLCAGLAALPDGWVVSTSLLARTTRLHHLGPLHVEARVLRRGKAAVVTSVAVRDRGAGGTVVADAVLTSAVLVPEHGVPRWTRPLVLAPEESVDAPPPLLEWIGVHPIDGGLAAELRDELRNPWGILHGGILATLVDAASELHAAERSGRPATTVDVALHFLSPARVGPVHARVAHVGTRPDGHVARVEIRDAGAADRVCAVAVTTARPL